MELLINIIVPILLTACSYMFFPVVSMIYNHKRYEKEKAQKIALWNSIIVGMLFCILTIELSENAMTWNAAPAVLYYWINRALLTKDDKTNKKIKKETYSVKYKMCVKCDRKLPNDSEFCHYCGRKLES